MPKDKEGSAAITFTNDICSDLSLKNMLYAVTVRSPVEKGMITSISQGDSVEGCTLITARDVPGSNLVDSAEGKIKVFCDGNVSYEGEPIGLLLGPDEETLERALSDLQIHYDGSPIEHYIQNSDEDAGNSELFGDKDRERLIEFGDCFTMESGKRKGIDAELAEAEVLVKNDWVYSLSPKNYREPCGALCSFNGKTMSVFSPSQWISNLREDLAEVLHFPAKKINVTRTKDWNRSTNSIWYNSIIACQAAVASYKLKTPVKLIYSREEQEHFIDCMKPILFHTELGADKDGRLKAMKVEVSVDSGSTNVFIGEIMDRLAIACTSCYKADNVSIRVTAHSSNTPPMSLDMQIIDSASFFAMESAVSALAQKLNTEPYNSLIFPSDIRKMNLNLHQEEADNMDFRNFTMPFKFSFPKAEESIDILFDSSDFKNKYIFYNRESLARSRNFSEQFTASPFSPPVRGIGFAIGYEGSFYYGSKVYKADQELSVTLEDYGDLTIHSPPISLPIQEIWTKLASSILDIRPSRIKIDSHFDSGSEPFIPESAYANISIMTVLLKKCCESIKRKREKEPLPVSVTHKLGSIQKKAWDGGRFMGAPFHSCSFAAATVEVELDNHSFSTKIRKIYIVISGGQILSSQAAEATIRLGIQKILRSLTDGKKTDCEDIKISFMKSDDNPEQIGELVYQVIPSAYLQATSQALGIQLNSLPQNYDSIFQQIRKLKSTAADDTADKDGPEQTKNDLQPDAGQVTEEDAHADNADAER